MPGTYISPAETGLYYLRSRYYNPQWGRFISADAYWGNKRIFDHNIFCYCRNNPVSQKDYGGFYAVTAQNVDLKEDLSFARSPRTILSNDEFIVYLNKMVEEKWQYDYKTGDNNQGMRYKHVDCVSTYRYVIQHYYDSRGYSYALPSKNGDALDSVKELAQRGVYDLQAIEPDYSNVVAGMALFLKSKEGKYDHVAYYIGNGKAIESNVKTLKYPAGVHEIYVSDYNFSECGYLLGLEYYDWR